LQSEKLLNKKNVWDEKTFYFGEHGPSIPRLIAIANEIKNTGYGNSVLELGCGLGVLKKLLGEGFEYFGCDISPSVVKLHNTPNIIHCNLDSDPLPFKTKRFNYVVCSGVVEYLADVKKFLNGIARSYGHERCLFLISIVNAAEIRHRLRMLTGHFPRYDPLYNNFYSFRDFQELLVEQGFHILRYHTLYYLTHRPRAVSRVISRIFPSLYGGQFLFICSSSRSKNDEVM
jgi:SAM-dependent methyltransferase